METYDKRLARILGPDLKAIAAGQHRPTTLHDGGGLYLKITDTGASWLFRYQRDGQPRKMGLGSFRDVSATKAREIATRHREVVATGGDPKFERSEAKRALKARMARMVTFREMAERVLEAIDAGNLHPITKQGWRASLRDHAFPKLGGLTLDEIDRAAILDVLRPIWPRINQTAKNVRQRIEYIFDEARDQGLTDRPNPARWLDLARGLAHYQPTKKPRPHPALPWKDVPAFYKLVRAQDGYTPRALMLAILSASRTQEALGARFDEFKPGDDGRLVGGVWTVPEERMKGKPGAREQHLVPISSEIAAVVEEMELIRRGPYLFPHRFKGNEPLTNSSIKLLLKNLNMAGLATTHGFRSSFKDWVSDNGFDDKAGERSLAHKVQGVAGHYDRTKMLEMRRDLMQRWSDFVTGRVVMGKPSVTGPTLQVIDGGRP